MIGIDTFVQSALADAIARRSIAHYFCPAILLPIVNHVGIYYIDTMPSSKSEMTWRLQVKDRFFADFAIEFDEKDVDLTVYAPDGTLFADTYLWAESKRGLADIPTMFAQLLLTIKKILDTGDNLPDFTYLTNTGKMVS